MTEPPDDPALFVFFNEIGIIEQLARNRFERVLPDGMTLAQFGVLNNFVRLGGERSPAGLARAFQVTKGAMTNTLQRLEAKGHVTLRPDPKDGRAKIVAITDAGRAARKAALAALTPGLAELAGAFPHARFDAAVPFLRELRMFLYQARDEV
jgi:DNA-binding MarR family transcriptional regulator